MAKLTPQQVSAKWLNNARNASTAYQQGVQSVDQAPGAKAAEKRQKWLQNLQASADKWQNNVAAVSLQEWRQATIEKGTSRYVQGVESGAPKMQEFMNEFIPFVRNVQAEVNAMPDLTLQDGINRVVKNIQLMAQFKKS